MKPRPAIVRTIWFLTLLLAFIGVTVVIRRMLHLFSPGATSSSSPDAVLDSGFAKHPQLTMLHIVPGLVFMVLGPLQFVRTLRSRRPRLHRWIGRVVIVSGLVIGSTALVMSPQMAIGGINETAATMLFAVVFLFALIKAFRCIRSRNVALHREWMIRAFAVGLAVATVRPIVGAFFATRSLTLLTPHEFFGIAFWLGFTIQLMVAEIWINYTRPRIVVA